MDTHKDPARSAGAGVAVPAKEKSPRGSGDRRGLKGSLAIGELDISTVPAAREPIDAELRRPDPGLKQVGGVSMKGPTRRRGKSRESIALVDAAADILREIQPATVRAVCYRLFVAGLIDGMSKTNTNRVSRQLVWGRESGAIPWEWIVDETREAERARRWSDPNAIITAAVSAYRKDYWSAQPYWVEVWSEKGTVRGTLAPVLNDYGLTFRVMHGYGSATAIQTIARETDATLKPLCVLYVGDWDPSGLHMSVVDLPARIQRYRGTATMHRVALNEADTSPGVLPSFGAATKAKDPRFKWFTERYGTQCWELDALPPPELRRRVQATVEALLDREAWEHMRKVEAAETENMGEFLRTWQATKSGQASICPSGTAHGGPNHG